ncbi:MAG: hypothetical protein LBT40_02540 [Deltaproteobacteria bacterium]|nr:hypothetical protein [Deltaproteobacteria bacterium]
MLSPRDSLPQGAILAPGRQRGGGPPAALAAAPARAAPHGTFGRPPNHRPRTPPLV